MCNQSEFGAALGVARLAMHVDKNIDDKKSIVNEIEISKNFEPNTDKINTLLKRYEIWKNLYSSNKKIAPNLLT